MRIVNRASDGARFADIARQLEGDERFDAVLVLGTLVWAMAAIWRRARWVALVNIPYLLWVGFATVLQLSITWLNR